MIKSQTGGIARLKVANAELAVAVVPDNPSIVVFSYEHAVRLPSDNASHLGSISAMNVAEHMDGKQDVKNNHFGGELAVTIVPSPMHTSGFCHEQAMV
mmetsp:Transcript_79297/g.144800  ORF Transcript_79297/g.144800 Transcript_79297/m.144800 type:complete len:98 (+) Transcript_79297:538-831(+)